MPESSLLAKFRSDRKRLPLHPLEKAVLKVVAVHLCFLPWALGTMHAWSQITSLVLATVGILLALIPRVYDGDLAPGIQIGGPRSEDREQNVGEKRNSSISSSPSSVVRPPSSVFRPPSSAFRLTMWPRLLHFPIFWIGLALLGYIALQASNPSWVWERSETQWWLRRVNDIPWLPTSVDTPFERFDIWRQFIIYAAAWLTVCTVWTGFTRRRSLQLLLMALLINAMLLAVIGFVQRFAGTDKYLFLMEWPVGHTAFASFIYRNHAGAYFGLLTFLAVSLAIWTFAQGERAGRKSTPSGLLFFCAVFLTAAVFFTLSRGAGLLVTLAWLAVAVWFWTSRRHSQTTGSTSPVIYGAIVLLFLAAIFISIREVDFSSIQTRFEYLAKNYNTPYDSVQWRVQAHTAADSMLSDHWLRGVGSGGFRYLFPEYLRKFPEIYAGGRYFWEHAHSDWREIPIEMGAAGTLLLLLGAGWWLRYFYRGRAVWHSLAVPVLIGCGQTLAHAWFDFPFQCPAILCTWLTLIAVSARWLELDSNA